MNSLDREFIDYYNSKLREYTSNISSLNKVELVGFNSESIYREDKK